MKTKLSRVLVYMAVGTLVALAILTWTKHGLVEDTHKKLLKNTEYIEEMRKQDQITE